MAGYLCIAFKYIRRIILIFGLKEKKRKRWEKLSYSIPSPRFKDDHTGRNAVPCCVATFSHPNRSFRDAAERVFS